MRKVDYELLAVIIAAEIAGAKRIQEGAMHSQTKALAVQREATALTIAEIFARRASVNEKAFLAACGIDPK